MKLVDMRDLGSRAAMRVGSSPFRRTRRSTCSHASTPFLFHKQNPRSHAGAKRRQIPPGAGKRPLAAGFPVGSNPATRPITGHQFLIQWVFTIGVQFFCFFRITKTEKSLTNRDLYTSQINTRRLLCCSVCCFPSV